MRLRFNNRVDYAVEFDAHDLPSFRTQGCHALRSFRTSQHRRVHRGEVGKDVLWTSIAHLDVLGERREMWFTPGTIKVSRGLAISFFEPADVIFPFIEADNLDEIFTVDEFDLSMRAERMWKMCVDCLRWEGAIYSTSMALDNVLQGEIWEQ